MRISASVKKKLAVGAATAARLTELRNKNGTASRLQLRRAGGITAVLITGALSLGVAGAPTAQAAPQDVINTFRNEATGHCLQSTPYGVVFSDVCDGDSWQNWNVHQWADGTRELKSLNSGLCLDDSDAYGVRTLACNATEFQSWYVRRWDDGTIELRNQATGRCLEDTYFHGVITSPCSATEFQSWY